MDGTSIKGALIAAFAVVAVFSSFVAGCTYTVTENNRRYYETMTQCIERGGTFVPTRGDNSSAACITR
jgi:hypothetical protein